MTAPSSKDPEEEEPSVLPPSQKKAVDEAFQELFGYQWGTTFSLPPTSRDANANSTADLLVQVLGPVRAARVLKSGKGSLLQQRPRRKPQATKKLVKWTNGTTTASSSTAAAAVVSSQPPKPQLETKLFAGQKIQVATSSSKAAATQPKTGIDSVLQQLAGPGKLTTVAKTSADWDSFKTETGLEAQLEAKAQGKDAFLVKQDFLTRVDNRKFELERTERDRERAKRGK